MKIFLVILLQLCFQHAYAFSDRDVSSLPKTIRCEGKRPYRYFHKLGPFIGSKVIERMYDLSFDHASMSYTADLRLIVQSQCCQVPTPEMPKTNGTFSTSPDGNLISSISQPHETLQFEINLAERTCSFRFSNGLKNFDGKLVSIDHRSLD